MLLSCQWRYINQHSPVSGNLHNRLFLEPTQELSDGFPTGFYEGAVALISCSQTEEGEQPDRMAGSQTKDSVTFLTFCPSFKLLLDGLQEMPDVEVGKYHININKR